MSFTTFPAHPLLRIFCFRLWKPRPWKPKYIAQPSVQFAIPPETYREVSRRDKGICAKCGIDTLALHAAIHYVNWKCFDCPRRWFILETTCDSAVAFRAFLSAIGRRARRWPRALWDADHIIPREEGGSDKPDNLQTLCLQCHYEKHNPEIKP